MDYANGLIIQTNHRLPGYSFIASTGEIHSYPAHTYPLDPLESTRPPSLRRVLAPNASFFVRNNPWIFSPTPRPALNHIVTKKVVLFPHFTSKIINWNRSGTFLLAHSSDGLFCYYPDNRSCPLPNNEVWGKLVPTQTDIASNSATIAVTYEPSKIIYTWVRNAEGKAWEQADSVPLYRPLDELLLLSQHGRYMPIPTKGSLEELHLSIYDRVRKKIVANIDYQCQHLAYFFQYDKIATRFVTIAQGRDRETLVVTSHNAETGALESTQTLPGVAKGFVCLLGHHTNLANDTGTNFFIPQDIIPWDIRNPPGLLGEF